MIQVTPELSVAETQALTAARQTADTSEEIKATDHVYIEKNGRYVLHRDVELMNGNHVLLDCQRNAFIPKLKNNHGRHAPMGMPILYSNLNQYTPRILEFPKLIE